MNLEYQEFSYSTPTDFVPSYDPLQWYAVRVRNQQEGIASRSLASRGLEEFHPVYRVRRNRADRTKVITLPLFAGYVFCRFVLSQKSLVLAAAGCVDIVRFGAKPAPIRDEDIAALQLIEKSGVGFPCPYMSEGRRVRICSGPFKDLEGYIQKIKNEDELVISLHLLQRSVSVHIKAEEVKAV